MMTTAAAASGGGPKSECGRRAGAAVSPQPSGGSCGAHGQRWTSESPPCGDDNARQGAGDSSNDVGAWDCLAGRREEKPQAQPMWRSSPCAAGLKRPHCHQGAPEHRGRQQQLEGEVEMDKLFARKCRELQNYVLPLASILNGLQSGRYRERLSSFQESVAMDRIRRILGVLQNPCAGERYFNIILKVEVMLKTWFPNVKPRDQQAGDHSQEATPSKRQKVSPVTTALPASASIPASLGAHSVSDKAQRAGAEVAPHGPHLLPHRAGPGGPTATGDAPGEGRHPGQCRLLQHGPRPRPRLRPRPCGLLPPAAPEPDPFRQNQRPLFGKIAEVHREHRHTEGRWGSVESGLS
ncbi:hypothetical protein AAFF_G00224730 [Aldrovandia affinis]|uniref:Circadian-associated transcriptional repressor n=1 Tax=Aldrovandia affinis TaxID=143900 RepID=A0AAD7X288_9TELE|nr:hypothetical protein AAFF_G00224730 [Aldrovandia affinis]